MESPATALFVRSASPGAVLRFLERRDAPHKPAEVLLSEAVSTHQWRALFAPPEYLVPLLAPLSIAFPPEALVAMRLDKLLTISMYRNGEPAYEPAFEDSIPTHSGFRLGFPAWAGPPPVFAWAKEKGIPTRYIKEPPKKIIDYSTIAVLDQRKLLVEDSPRLYRFPLR
ncbi:MAG: hypothetical protein QM758_08745 [Armatimonas sp.]